MDHRRSEERSKQLGMEDHVIRVGKYQKQWLGRVSLIDPYRLPKLLAEYYPICIRI